MHCAKFDILDDLENKIKKLKKKLQKMFEHAVDS